MRILLLIIFILIVNCKFNKVVDNHGVHYLDKKQQSLTVNKSNDKDYKYSSFIIACRYCWLIFFLFLARTPSGSLTFCRILDKKS